MESKKIVKYIIANVKVPISVFDDQSYEYLKNQCITDFEETDVLSDFPSHKINLQEKIKQIFTLVENLETSAITKTDENPPLNDSINNNKNEILTEKLPQKVSKEEIQHYKKRPKQNQTFKNRQTGSPQQPKNHRFSIKQRLNVEIVASDLVQQLMEKEV